MESDDVMKPQHSLIYTLRVDSNRGP
jgi:hypothetical protein